MVQSSKQRSSQSTKNVSMNNSSRQEVAKKKVQQLESSKNHKRKDSNKHNNRWSWLTFALLGVLGAYLAFNPSAESSDVVHDGKSNSGGPAAVASSDGPAASLHDSDEPHRKAEETTDKKHQSSGDDDESSNVPQHHFAVLEVLPHDTRAFCQGLTFGNGHLWEGTGHYGASELRRVDPASGTVLDSVSLDSQYFGEGIAFYTERSTAPGGESRLIQLSWKEKTGWIYNANTLELLKAFAYETVTGEGWGITYNPTKHEFIVSDGSEYLMFWDAETLKETKRLQVMYEREPGVRQPVKHLNEIEWVDGDLLSNVWYQDVLIKIDMETGYIKTVYNFGSLYVNRSQGVDCFNCISITDKPGELWVTGKWWPHMYRIKLLI